MANTDYKAACFPFTVGGGPGARHTVSFTVAADVESNPVATVADRAAYFAANNATRAKHDRFSALVLWFQQYGTVVSAETNGNNVVTLKFEQKDLFTENTTVGKPAYSNKLHRTNAYGLAGQFVTVMGSATGVTAISSITVDGVSQSS